MVLGGRTGFNARGTPVTRFPVNEVTVNCVTSKRFDVKQNQPITAPCHSALTKSRQKFYVSTADQLYECDTLTSARAQVLSPLLVEEVVKYETVCVGIQRLPWTTILVVRYLWEGRAA